MSLEWIDAIRLFRIAEAEGGVPKTAVSAIDLAGLANELEEAVEDVRTPFTAETCRSRLRPLVETPVAEGFFAAGVVLVEGEEDRALVAAAAAASDLDLESAGVALLPVHGKENLDRPLLVFRSLGVPVYVVFDGDAGPRGSERTNRLLLRLLGAEVQDFPDTTIAESFTCLRTNLMAEVKAEIGPDAFARVMRAAQDDYGFVDTGEKNSHVLRSVLERLWAEGLGSASLDGLVQRIAEFAQAAARA